MKFSVFFYINVLCFVVYSSMAVFVVIKSKYKLDVKGWVNMGINTVSFAIKMIAWTYLISIYDWDLA